MKIAKKLIKFVDQRPGLEFCNYGNLRAFRAEQRVVSRQKREFYKLLAGLVAVSENPDVQLFAAGASGRLTWDTKESRWEYCTGQYFSTEFRAAACRIVADAIWSALRAQYHHAPGSGDAMRADCAQLLGTRLAEKWFGAPLAKNRTAREKCAAASAELRALSR
jgi:hypothetical protein